jgi:hypothetical protein
VNTVNSSDITDGQVKSVDIGNGEVNSADVKDESLTTFDVSTFIGADIVDGTLKDEDIGHVAVRDIRRYVGPVPAHGCTVTNLLGYGNVDGDHLVVTPWFLDVDSRLSYTAEYDTRGYQQALVRVCNPTDGVVDDEYTTFNLLAINGN